VPITHAVSQAGVLDLHGADRLGLSDHAARELLGSTPDEERERWRLASPAALLPLGVPQLVVHGEEDDVVPASISAEYVRAARAAGDPCLASLLPGVGHYEHLDPRSDAWAAVRDFLESLAG
jgi:pimeloyl-ACP methyl ester carboxylesterase